MNKLNIKHLLSGGLITNYYCTSQCRHCLYGCSPHWPKDYITPKQARININTMQNLGCYSIHIGGGEPFLKPEELTQVLDVAREENMGIDYIETNSSWYKDEQQAADILYDIKERNINTLLLSISPFHTESIPFTKVRKLIEACNKTGIQVFPWVQSFISDISQFDENTTHTLEEYINRFGKNYLRNIPSRYWIHLGGRAVNTFKEVFPLIPAAQIIEQSASCEELTDTSHFHTDLYGYYIPGLCSGLAIKNEDLGSPLDPEKYPLITLLYNKGVKALYKKAEKEYDFQPQEKYLNKCHLCLDIRHHLATNREADLPELHPKTFYEEVFR